MWSNSGVLFCWSPLLLFRVGVKCLLLRPDLFGSKRVPSPRSGVRPLEARLRPYHRHRPRRLLHSKGSWAQLTRLYPRP